MGGQLPISQHVEGAKPNHHTALQATTTLLLKSSRRSIRITDSDETDFGVHTVRTPPIWWSEAPCGACRACTCRVALSPRLRAVNIPLAPGGGHRCRGGR